MTRLSPLEFPLRILFVVICVAGTLATGSSAFAQSGASRPEDVPDLRQHAGDEISGPSGQVRIRFAGESNPPGVLDMSWNFKNAQPFGFTLLADEKPLGSSVYVPLTKPTRFRFTLGPPQKLSGVMVPATPCAALTTVYNVAPNQKDPANLVFDYSLAQGSDFAVEIGAGKKQAFVDLRQVLKRDLDTLSGWGGLDYEPNNVDEEKFPRALVMSQLPDMKSRLTGNLGATLKVVAYRQTPKGRETVGTTYRQIRVTHYGELYGFVHPPLHGSEKGITIERLVYSSQAHKQGTRMGRVPVHSFSGKELTDSNIRGKLPIPLMPDDLIRFGANDGAYMRFLLDDAEINWMVMGNPHQLPQGRMAAIRLGMRREANEGKSQVFDFGFRNMIPLTVGFMVSAVLDHAGHGNEAKSVLVGCALLSAAASTVSQDVLAERPSVIWRQMKTVRVNLRSTLVIDNDGKQPRFYLLDGHADIFDDDQGRRVSLQPGQYAAIAGTNAFVPQSFTPDALPPHLRQLRQAMESRKESPAGEHLQAENPAQEKTKIESRGLETTRRDVLSNEQRFRRTVASLRKRGCKLETSGDMIEELDATGVRLNDDDLKELAGRDAKIVILTESRITDEGVGQLAKMGSITWLDLGKTSITDASLTKIANLERLFVLNLNDTEVSDKGIRKLAGLKKLNTLMLGGTRVTDACLSTLVSLKNLQVVEAPRTGITAEGQKWAKEKRPDLPILLFDPNAIELD